MTLFNTRRTADQIFLVIAFSRSACCNGLVLLRFSKRLVDPLNGLPDKQEGQRQKEHIPKLSQGNMLTENEVHEFEDQEFAAEQDQPDEKYPQNLVSLENIDNLVFEFQDQIEQNFQQDGGED